MRRDINGEPKYDVPLWQKMTLTIEEANALSGVGICKLREMSEEEDCPFVIWNGGKRRIKRKALEKFLEESFSI